MLRVINLKTNFKTYIKCNMYNQLEKFFAIIFHIKKIIFIFDLSPSGVFEKKKTSVGAFYLQLVNFLAIHKYRFVVKYHKNNY